MHNTARRAKKLISKEASLENKANIIVCLLSVYTLDSIYLFCTLAYDLVFTSESSYCFSARGSGEAL